MRQQICKLIYEKYPDYFRKRRIVKIEDMSVVGYDLYPICTNITPEEVYLLFNAATKFEKLVAL